ncbi:MAG TPA: polymer-forming cytoskeletal protein [Pyrinomonadaceae bacterium]|nr:polymer-forming cytoskeletal protein [Pyrinomonadaceae bacterium]
MIRMGRNSKTEESDASNYPTSSPSSPTPAAYQYGNENMNTVSKPATDSENIARDIKDGKLSGFVGHGTSLTGDTTFQMMLRVDGHLTGTVSSDGGTLIVGDTGQLDANVSVAIANVNGQINGDVIATEKINLGRTARVVGNIMTPKLVIEDGAMFEGGCSMLKAREDEEKAAETATASTSSYGSSSYGSTSSTSQYAASSYAASSTDDDDDAELSADDDDDDDEERSESASV